MRYVPWHVKEVRSTGRDAPVDPARRAGLSVGAAFTMIRKEIQELRRQTARQIEPAVFEQRLHDLAGQIGALQAASPGGDAASPGQDAFLGQLRLLLAQNLGLLQQQVAATAADAISGPAESIRRDVASLKEIQASVDRRTQDTFEAVYGTIERIVDRLATIEEELRERNSDPSTPPPSETPPAEGDDAHWSGLPPVRPSAVPESPGPGQPAAARVGGAERSVLLLRQPAGVPDVAVDASPVREPGKRQPDVHPPQCSAKRDAGLATAAHRAAVALAGVFKAAPADHLTPQKKAVVLGIGAALLGLFAITLTLTLDFYKAPTESLGEPISVAAMASAADPAGDEQARATKSSPDPLVRPGAGLNPPPLSDGAAPAPAAIPAVPPAMAATPAPVDTTPWDAEALMRNVLLPATASHDPWPQFGAPAGADPAATPLPPAIGSKALIAAAQAGDPGAAYEIAIRFTQSRNAGPDFAKAAVWLDRAAQAGLAPAQFRLGSMYDKGIGVRKDFAEARRLYLAAAAKGHAKAMHNLAVLYTRNIDGPADYGTAVEWFRKAAAYGTVDSQYNLGILYARGTGIERDLVESYKWFTLAAKGGDKDAARKRDEVAKALDAGQLETARASAEAFVATPQPDEATAVKAPAGGWDQVAAAATTKTRTPARPERSPR